MLTSRITACDTLPKRRCSSVLIRRRPRTRRSGRVQRIGGHAALLVDGKVPVGQHGQQQDLSHPRRAERCERPARVHHGIRPI
jgi:hypothetical protein